MPRKYLLDGWFYQMDGWQLKERAVVTSVPIIFPLQARPWLCCPHLYSFVFFLRFYLFERERERARGGAEGKGEADSALSEEPDTGLDPTTLRSRP